MNKRYYPMSEEKFKEHVEPLIIAGYKWKGRPPRIDHYQLFCAVMYVLRTCCSWRDLPECYGYWHVIYKRFHRWSQSGLWWKMVYQLQQSKKIALELVMVDSTSIKLHRHGSGALKKTANKA
jgi:transposase